jgi:hypothetical protein
MTRSQIFKLYLLLIFFTITSLVFISISNRIDQQAAPTIMVNRKDRLKPINRRVYNSSNREKKKFMSTYYRLSEDDRYHYEFRYELYMPRQNEEYRLMLILYGAKRACKDMWDFSVGERTLSAMRNAGYSILALCSERMTCDIDLPIGNNSDVKYMYLSLQIWMNTVYYPQFQRYPLLYIHGTSRGSRLAGLLCRVLPIQAQILYIFPGHQEAMVIPSDYDLNLQTRLLVDSTFANWFYFGLCYNATYKNLESQKLCPFQEDRHHYYPIPPTFFTFLGNDPYQRKELYTNLITDIRSNATRLGGKLLKHFETMQFDVLPPADISISYMQENFNTWRSKPNAARLFFEHFTNPEKYENTDPERHTCWCSKIDFKHFEVMPHITETWSRKKYNEYSDYVRDIRIFIHAFCEEVCGDLMTTHAMASRNINKALVWAKEMDYLRRLLYVDDYVKRSLRIWMYDKTLLIKNATYFSSQEANWINISKEYQMYSPEYYLQDYFQRLNGSNQIYRRHLEWATNPLLADYFIIPSDLMFFYFNQRPSTLDSTQFRDLYVKLNENYFETLLTNVRTIFPYWTLADQADQIGANHIIAMPGGRNMGFLYDKLQNILKNVIQLGFTGVRQDLLPPNSPPQYSYRNMIVTYRHHYDVIIPQSTPLNWNRSKSNDLDLLIKKKKRLFYFAGVLWHSMSPNSARFLLSSIWRDPKNKQTWNMTIQIQNRPFVTMTIVDGHIKSHEYIDAIQSSIFSLCPEGFLPWSPRLYESIQLGAIPILLADNIVLPFERFIDWRSISVKINVSNIRNITNFVHRIDNFEKYIKQKLKNALPYLHAFRWPYSANADNEFNKHVFQPQEDLNGKAINVFHYISLELRCRRLEQWYGLTVKSSTPKSIEAQRLACTNHPTICPCHNEQRSLAFQEYI